MMLLWICVSILPKLSLTTNLIVDRSATRASNYHLRNHISSISHWQLYQHIVQPQIEPMSVSKHPIHLPINPPSPHGTPNAMQAYTTTLSKVHLIVPILRNPVSPAERDVPSGSCTTAWVFSTHFDATTRPGLDGCQSRMVKTSDV